MQQQAVRQIEEEIDRHTIRAPFDGYVTKEFTEVGQWVARGGAIVQVVDVAEVDVLVPVLENYVGRLQLGDDAQVQFGAEIGPTLLQSAKVVAIVPQADARSRSFPVKVRMKNMPGPDGRPLIQPGMFAKVTLPVGGRGPALLVPKDALVPGEKGLIVWVVQPAGGDAPPGQGAVRRVPVVYGAADGDWIEVRGELSAGQMVVVEGNERINPMRPVNVLNLP